MPSSPLKTSIVALLVFLCSLAFFSSFADYGINFEDEGTLLYQAERVADGQTPYVDFHIGYTPAVYYLHAALLKWGGYSVIPGRLLLAAVNSCSAALLTLIAARFAPLWISWLPALLYVSLIPNYAGSFASFNIPYPVWYNVFFFLAGLFSLLKFSDRGAKRWIIVAGLFAGIDFMFKPNVGLLHLATASFVVLAAIPWRAVAVRKDKAGATGSVAAGSRGNTTGNTLANTGNGSGNHEEAGKGTAGGEHGAGTSRRWDGAWWWLMWTATLAGVWVLFSGKAGVRELIVFLAPATTVAAIVAVSSSRAQPLELQPRIVGSSLLLAAAFFAINIPWMAAVMKLLGLQRFLVDVLFIGADFEKFYYIGHPPVLMAAAAGALFLALAAAAPPVLRRLKLSPEIVAAAGVALATVALWLLASHSLMPEGFARAVANEFEAAVFPLAFVIFATAMPVWLLAVFSEARSQSATGTAAPVADNPLQFGILVSGALLMYLQIYPRSDYMHWVGGAPLLLVLAIVLLAKLVERWNPSPNKLLAICVRTAWLTPLVAIACLRMWEPMASLQHTTWGAGAPAARLDNARAPVRINQGKAIRYSELAETARFLHEHTREGEKVFTFPMLDLISFLSDRDNPTRHGYFYPYWPGREVEAEVVAALRSNPPPLAVVYHDHAMFFVQAPMYYYGIGAFLRDNYSPLARIGRYTVLAHNGRTPVREETIRLPELRDYLHDSGALAWITQGLSSADPARRTRTLAEVSKLFLEGDLAEVIAALSDPVQEVRNSAVWALRHSHGGKTVHALARAVEKRTLAPRETIAAIRTLGSSADSSLIPDLLPLLDGYGDRVRAEVSAVLDHTSSKDLARSFWVHAPAVANAKLLPQRKKLRRRMLAMAFDPFIDPRLRAVALWACDNFADEVLAPILWRALEANDLRVKIRAILGLLERGYGKQVSADIRGLLAYDDMIAPRLLLMAGESRTTDKLILTALHSDKRPARVTAAWLASLAGGKRLNAALARLLDDPDPELRKAALWGLQSRRANKYLDTVKALRLDPDYGVRDFAARAARALAALEN